MGAKKKHALCVSLAQRHLVAEREVGDSGVILGGISKLILLRRKKQQSYEKKQIQ